MRKLLVLALPFLLAVPCLAGFTGEQSFEGDVEFRNPVTFTDPVTIEDAVTINETNADVDFTIEGDTVEDLVKVDASADAVGIGGDATPDAALELSFPTAGTSAVLIISSQNASTDLLTMETTAGQIEIDLAAGIELGFGDASPDAILEVVPEAADAYALLVSSQNGSTNLFAIDPTAQQIELANSYLMPWSRTKAQISALTPAAVGEIIYCSDCTVKNTCISTGTALSDWMRQDLATAGCGPDN